MGGGSCSIIRVVPGASVSPPDVSSNWAFYRVYFTSPSEGWAVGWDAAVTNNSKGVLLHYSGGTWTSVSPPSVSSNWDAWALHFTSSNEGWVVGRDLANGRGVLLDYSGGTWTSVSPPTVSSQWRLSGVHFTSANEGWAVGPDNTNKIGVLLHFKSPVSPNQGTIGTEFAIAGSGFGTTRGKVLIGNVAPKILEWNDSSIRCQLAKSPPLGTYDVTVQPKGASPIVCA